MPNLRNVCPTCGSVTFYRVPELPPDCPWCPAAPLPLQQPAPGASRHMAYVYRHELVCLLCGRLVDHTLALSETATLLVPCDMRCPACGGQPISSGAFTRRLVPIDNLFQPVRRGRPPNWLVEQRRVERERQFA